MTGDWDGRIYRGDSSAETVSGTEADETLLGAGGDDFLRDYYESDDLLRGGGGDDGLSGGTGKDTIEGGSGADQVTLQLDDLRDVVDLGSGEDSLTLASGALRAGIVMTVNGSVMRVSYENKEVAQVTGLEAVNAYTGRGSDRLSFGSTDDSATIGAGRDTVDGGGGDDFVVVQGYDSGRDVVEGGAGDDFLNFSAELIRDTSTAISVDTSDGLQIMRGGKTILEATGVEAFAITASGEDDTLEGGESDDSFYGKAGADLIDGGKGSDTVGFQGETGPVSVTLVKGKTVTVMIDGEANDRLTSIENLQGGDFGDTLIGDRGDNLIYDDIGAEGTFVDGGKGVDTLIIQAGGFDVFDVDLMNEERIRNIENVTGGGEADTLKGDDGDNRIENGSDLDVMTGRGGADVFVYSRLITDEVIPDGDYESMHAEITDFTKGQDTIDLSNLHVYPEADERTDDWTFRGAKGFSGDEDELRVETTKSATWVLADFDGDKRADFAVKLDGGLKLTESDFIF